MTGGEVGRGLKIEGLYLVCKVCIGAKWPIRSALISSFSSMKRLGVFHLPLGWDASPSQGYAKH